jgi:hypothetical protein
MYWGGGGAPTVRFAPVVPRAKTGPDQDTLYIARCGNSDHDDVKLCRPETSLFEGYTLSVDVNKIIQGGPFLEVAVVFPHAQCIDTGCLSAVLTHSRTHQ